MLYFHLCCCYHNKNTSCNRCLIYYHYWIPPIKKGFILKPQIFQFSLSRIQTKINTSEYVVKTNILKIISTLHRNYSLTIKRTGPPIPKCLVGNVLFWNVFKILEKKDTRFVLKTFWNAAETCRKIEDMTLYLLHI